MSGPRVEGLLAQLAKEPEATVSAAAAITDSSAKVLETWDVPRAG